MRRLLQSPPSRPFLVQSHLLLQQQQRQQLLRPAITRHNQAVSPRHNEGADCTPTQLIIPCTHLLWTAAEVNHHSLHVLLAAKPPAYISSQSRLSEQKQQQLLRPAITKLITSNAAVCKYNDASC
jgi:hypothetical protein